MTRFDGILVHVRVRAQDTSAFLAMSQFDALRSEILVGLAQQRPPAFTCGSTSSSVRERQRRGAPLRPRETVRQAE